MVNKILIAIYFLLFATGAFAQAADTIVGKFINMDRNEIITIYKDADGFYYGKNEKGEILLHKIVYDKDERTWRGKMIPPGKNFSMSVKIDEESFDKLKMTVTKFFMSRTNTLIRIK